MVQCCLCARDALGLIWIDEINAQVPLCATHMEKGEIIRRDVGNEPRHRIGNRLVRFQIIRHFTEDKPLKEKNKKTKIGS